MYYKLTRVTNVPHIRIKKSFCFVTLLWHLMLYSVFDFGEELINSSIK